LVECSHLPSELDVFLIAAWIFDPMELVDHRIAKEFLNYADFTFLLAI